VGDFHTKAFARQKNLQVPKCDSPMSSLLNHRQDMWTDAYDYAHSDCQQTQTEEITKFEKTTTMNINTSELNMNPKMKHQLGQLFEVPY
jgi:hypothetical protein